MISDNNQPEARGYPFAPGQVQVEKSNCHCEDPVQTLDVLCQSWCSAWQGQELGIGQPSSCTMAYRLELLPYRCETYRCIHYQNDRQDDLSQCAVYS